MKKQLFYDVFAHKMVSKKEPCAAPERYFIISLSQNDKFYNRYRIDNTDDEMIITTTMEEMVLGDAIGTIEDRMRKRFHINLNNTSYTILERAIPEKMFRDHCKIFGIDLPDDISEYCSYMVTNYKFKEDGSRYAY